MNEKLYDYYDRESFLPTHGRFETSEALRDHAASRQNVFTDKLQFPPAVFQGASLLEFGPDTGENALVAADWGARCTLVEPHLRAHEKITDYFERFGLVDRLDGLHSADVESFETDRRFDIVLAEGFVYTIQPSTIWLSRFQELLKPGGFCIVSYYERSGAFMELCMKAIFQLALKHTRGSAIDTAWSLYEAKWNSIPHVRKFDAWVMDVLQNPFVRTQFLIDSSELCGQAVDCGLRLYSSWPIYNDPLVIHWHKIMRGAEDACAAQQAHIARARLSFLTGKNHYFGGSDGAKLKAINDLVDAAIDAVDVLADPDGASKAQQSDDLTAALSALQGHLRDDDVGGSQAERDRSVRWLESLETAFGYALAGNIDVLYECTNTDPSFVAHWGIPAHYAVFEASPNRPQDG
ncbi:MAG: methyltransferase domain-containing protein [Rhodospirillales bacterium]